MDQESIKITRTGIGRWEVTYEPAHGWHDADQERDFEAALQAWLDILTRTGWSS